MVANAQIRHAHALHFRIRFLSGEDGAREELQQIQGRFADFAWRRVRERTLVVRFEK